jgi:hypothetical protein
MGTQSAMILLYIERGWTYPNRKISPKLNLQVSDEFERVGIEFGLSLIWITKVKSSSRGPEVLVFA